VQEPEPKLLSVTEGALRLGVDCPTLRAWIRRGLVPAVRLPGTNGAYRIDPRDLILALRPARETRS
jgi:excisionase family DNA binding protein